jgi:DHA1 family bicyclomycin/chloramphenicol resistance-like MFS transporter
MDKPPEPARLAPMLAILVALSPFSLDLYLPALPSIADDFNTDIHLIELSISTYLIGMALGQLLGAPLSDRNGRRPLALIGLGIFLVATIGIIFCQTAEQLLWLRLVQALGGGCATVNSAAIVRDLYDEVETARMFSLISMIMMAAPLIAPAVGAVMLIFFSWRSVFVLLALYALLVMLVVIYKLPETVRERQRSATARAAFREIAASFALVMTRRRAVGFALCTAFAHGCMFAFLTDSAFVYIEYFGVSPSFFPILFGANIVTLMAANRVNYALLRRYHPRQILPFGSIAQILCTSTLFVYAVLFDARLYVVAPLIMLSIGCLGFVVSNAFSSYMSYFSRNAGTANAVGGTLRAGAGAVIGILIGILHDGSLFPMTAAMMLAAMTAGILVVVLRIAQRRAYTQPDPTAAPDPEL